MSKTSLRRRRLRAKRKPPASPRRLRAGDANAFARAGMQAWSAHLESIERSQLSELENGSHPGPGLDTERPWWCMVLTTEPVFLHGEERSACEMLMGLCAVGSRGVDWPMVARRAPEIFAQIAQAGGSRTVLHLCPFDSDFDNSSPEPGSSHLRLSGRCYVSMPGYHDPDFWSSISPDDKAFDRRRAKRRSLGSPPKAWTLLHGPLAALDLWSSGFSPSQARGHRFSDWAASARSLVLAMLEAGASRVERAPGFFAKFPSAMEKENLAAIDAARSDELRQRWDIEGASGPGIPRRRGSI